MTSRNAAAARPSISNLVPVWDSGADETGAGSYVPEAAPAAVARAVTTRPARRIAPPEQFDAAREVEPRVSAFSYLLEREEDAGPDDLPIELDERAERRSAFEIAFLMISGALSVVLAAPPLVQILLAAHGTQA